jgi:excisionase family DNA binding protein
VEFTKSLYSPHEVAEMAGVHPSTILNYIASGRLYAIKLSARTFRIPVRSVIALLGPESLAPSTLVSKPGADVAAEFVGDLEEADVERAGSGSSGVATG